MIVENVLYLFQMDPNDIIRDDKIFWILVCLSYSAVPGLYQISQSHQEAYFGTKMHSWKSNPNVKDGYSYEIT